EAKKEELPDEEGSDLPDEVAEKLKDLAEQLKEFMEEQRKVISSTEDLAKIPVEEFTEDDKAKQEALAAIEEKWEKFMKEAHSDLSKLPTQDFSTEQLLSELVETFSEVEMAKDALTKKSAEIAVPVEQAGLEAAEELTTHLEKWLPDEPDRAKWSMEEPLGEFETPMTELPSELEDLVGELMEGEEDIFDEMEDVASSWADSLDKGAGWDAMDGPISNMSAQGVTGNHLPNTSEIGGRSGEGRTGKSSGEMVEDSATGKGGRKTPTRLSPDAFMGGEINDTSKDPPGGATGGGKVSGAGGEGLEGPVPPELDREMQRLKGAQASLRNKAERIGMQLKARNFPEADIELTLAHLRSLEADLKDGRYSNIARRRNVILTGLDRSREFVEGTARVELDRSRGPEGFDEEVGSAKDEVDPAGYEDLLRAYREAIRSGEPAERSTE
ncbi:MAG: BAR domain-containing protein, partial [Planctomycetota bacterium]